MRKRLTTALLIILDIAIIVFAFLWVAKFRDGTKRILTSFIWWRSLIAFTLIWVLGSLWSGKYSLTRIHSPASLIRRIIGSDVFAAAVIFGLMYVFNQFHYSRYIVMGTMLGSFLLEVFIFGGIFFALRFRKENQSFASTTIVTRSEALEESQSPAHFLQPLKSIPAISHESYSPPYSLCEPDDSILVPLWQNYLADREDLFSFVNDYLELSRFCKSKTLVLNSETYFNIKNEAPDSRQLFVNLHRINDFRRLNLYLIRVNEMLMEGGVFLCHGQTITQRRSQFNHRFTPVFGSVLYFLDFLLKRVAPKLPILQGWYFALTKGRNRALSETEMLGRFYFCGFELVNKRELHGNMHFILRKARSPRTDKNPTYGPLIRLKRLGKDGKTIYVKKLRTMHPYSEYLQDYVYQTNALQEGGKFKDDFRVTSWGKVLRALWIDELPQFLNFFKGELSLVGVRALSEHYFSLYPPDMQELRLKFRPGLLPPFYADLPCTFEEIVESERRYIDKKQKSPLITDWTYFWKGVWNILIKKNHSY